MKKLACFVFIFLITICYGTVSLASELNFHVETVTPINQKKTRVSYFDLLVEPNSTQELVVNITNDTDEDIIVIPSIQTAATNINGVVVYKAGQGESDASLQYKIEDLLISSQEEITIPKNSTIDYRMTLTIPENGFIGTLAGGISFQEKEDTDTSKASQDSSGVSIENSFSYAIAILLTQSNEAVDPELTLENAFAGQVNTRNVMNAEIHNITPTYVNQLSIDAQITKKGKSEVLYSTSKEAMQMAPSSYFNFPVPLNGKKLEAGEYTMTIVAKSGDYEWKLTKDFEITKEEASSYNESDVSIETDYTIYYLIAGFSSIILFLLFLLWKKNKRNKTES